MPQPDPGMVAVHSGEARYPENPPYPPCSVPPEYPFPADGGEAGDNPAYDAVRECLRLLGLDSGRYGSKAWSPLGEIIHPGDTVVLKPNFVREFRETQPGHGDCLVTHGSIIRAVCDYVYIATEGKGRIIVADAPQNDADFDAIRRIAGLEQIQVFYRRNAGFNVEVYDLRSERAHKIDGVIVGHESLPGDPAGYVKVNLGRHSAFAEINQLCHRLYGSEYDTDEVRRHHHDEVHEYLISRTVLDADVVISLPKLKTHKKTGITVNLKNLVGINGNKNWLPHHREGTPSQGGDEYADDAMEHRLERLTVRQFKRLFPRLGPLRSVIAGPAKAIGKRLFGDTNGETIRSGNWHGNDTTWRMVLDLNRVLLYADADGVLNDHPLRRFFSFVDGIISGEGNGPLDPRPKPTGVVLAGANPVAVDLACARLMGFDYRRLPMLRRAMEDHALPLASLDVGCLAAISNSPAYHHRIVDFHGPCVGFEPHFGWRGRAKIREREHETSAHT
jgi:uncharacterized protein (DUF362 family)